MKTIDYSAFPLFDQEGKNDKDTYGLTKREYTAIEFAKSMMTNPALMEAVTSWDITMGDAKTKIAVKAIEYADELLKQLENEKDHN